MLRFTDTIPTRDTEFAFKDDSTINRDRIMFINWYLTDRYEDNSMTTDERGNDNAQEWLNQDKDTEITTKINSQEDHTLTQEVHWDDGFKEVILTKEYTIKTSKSSINTDFDYFQIFVTGPEIQFSNITTVNDNAVQLRYDLFISDKDNDGNDTSKTYEGLGVNDTQDVIYDSVSNSPFDNDTYNKEVKIKVWFDDGWNEVSDEEIADILVKPNRISQDFTLTPIRHPSDTETASNSITGNNPIKFEDSSDTERIDSDGNKDFSFIQNVKYTITEDCGE